MSYRVQRVSSTLKYSLGEIFLHDLQDPEFRLVAITEVSMSKDLRKARVFVTSPTDHMDEVMARLQKAKGFIRHLLPRRMKLKFVPELEFYPDERSRTEGMKPELKND